MARLFFMHGRVLSAVLYIHISMLLCNILTVYSMCVALESQKTVEQGILALF